MRLRYCLSGSRHCSVVRTEMFCVPNVTDDLSAASLYMKAANRHVQNSSVLPQDPRPSLSIKHVAGWPVNPKTLCLLYHNVLQIIGFMYLNRKTHIVYWVITIVDIEN